MAKPENLTGSWFKTGYHGHVRNTGRSDFINEYRYLAKPCPPHKFINRLEAPARKHLFSIHDNRSNMTYSGQYFEQGLGKRKFRTDLYAFHPELLAWMPKQRGFDRTAPKSSVYQYDFRGNPPTEQKQLLVTPAKTSFDEDYRKTTTCYRYAHCNDNPNKETLTSMCQGTRPRSLPQRKPRNTDSGGRESVASCMSWYIPKPPTRPTVPACTQTVPTSKLTPAATELFPPCVETASPPAEIKPCTQATQDSFNTSAPVVAM